MKVVWCFFVLMLMMGGDAGQSLLPTGLCAVLYEGCAVCIEHALRGRVCVEARFQIDRGLA